ncbi:CZB domain-containing protein [Salmonella enterica]|uniref:CZB domain-containing protein n=1 Tax=Salmonella TaxID=590 RepID=UPI0002BBF518|nr:MULTISPECIES: CZB domain-containing protein [Salmonella]EBE4781784.1 chemotaxis protein [Salmonella enterica]ECM8012240.1 chemotaxis protein [Salmonella enterica subsp. enterica serovar Newport]EBU0430672.1 chemotaxis protein [Salmonella enterica]ECV9049706.1 chemotaxis protein [Salmonella enterica subsp. enterica serovar Newport]EGP3502150.1 chemotaxis protein [Salmonella enterica subsp. enterica serovar Newport]
MPPESTKKLQHIYRLQQGKLVSISNLTETLCNIRENLEAFSVEQKALAGELENSTNKCRVTIRRLARKCDKEEGEENKENTGDANHGSLSPARKKSFLQVMREVHDTSSSVAKSIYRLSASHKYSAELLDLTVIMVKHFLWRERIFMAIILGSHENEALKQVSVRSCALGRWYDGRGKRTYSHLPAYRSLGEVHSRYHTVINELIDKGMEGMVFSELSAELAQLEMLSQQLVGFIGQIQHHVTLLQNLPDD